MIRVHGSIAPHACRYMYAVLTYVHTQDTELLFQDVHETIIPCSKNAQAKLNHSKREHDVVTQAKHAPYICILSTSFVFAGPGWGIL